MIDATQIHTGDRAEWLEARKNGIGASDVAAIVGLSRYRTPLQVWADKTDRLDDNQSEAMRWGQILQDVVLDEWENQHPGLIAAQRDTLWHNNGRPWMMATVDGLAFEGERGADGNHYQILESAPLGVVEAKTTGGFGTWDDGELPEDYEIQVQWQLAVTGLTNGWVAALHGGRRFQVIPVEQDLPLQRRLIEICGQWWDDYVVKDLEPPAVAGDVSVLSGLYDTDDGRVTKASPTVKQSVRRLARAKANEKRWKAVAKDEQAFIHQHMAEATELVDPDTGELIYTWREQSRDGYTVQPTKFRVGRVK